MLNSERSDRILRMTSDEFFGAGLNRNNPVILTDVVSNWNAYSVWTAEHLTDLLGERQVEVGVSNNEKFDYGEEQPQFSTRNTQFDQAIKDISLNPGKKEYLYIMQKPVAVDFPELLGDIVMPYWLEISTVAPHIWIGSKGNFTALHYDISDNYIAQVTGTKRFMLYDPAQLEFLYPNSPEHSLSHVSQVDVTAPDLSRYPKFQYAKSIEFELNAGEMLYLPSHWWHAVESQSFNIMVNFWTFADDLNLYLNNPTGVRSLWFIYKMDLLQSLKGLLVKNNVSFMDCAKKMVLTNPAAAIIFSHAALVDFVLSIGASSANEKYDVTQLSAQTNQLFQNGVLKPNDIELLQNHRFLALQTFTEEGLTARQANEVIFEVNNFISKITESTQVMS